MGNSISNIELYDRAFLNHNNILIIYIKMLLYSSSKIENNCICLPNTNKCLDLRVSTFFSLKSILIYRKNMILRYMCLATQGWNKSVTSLVWDPYNLVCDPDPLLHPI